MLKLAVIGATGAVGRRMVSELERIGPLNFELGLFASPRSAGEFLPFRGRSVEVRAFELSEMKNFQFALMSAGGDFSKQYALDIVKLGCSVIDNSSAWRMDDRFPLVVPEVNGGLLAETDGPVLVANPNCSTIQMVVSLEPLRKFGIERVDVATYQSVSGTGQKGLVELDGQLRSNDLQPTVYARRIASNVIAAIGEFDREGHCVEELKMVNETRKILGMRDLRVLSTTVRVPTRVGHGEAVTVTLQKEATRTEVLNSFKSAAGLKVYEGLDGFDVPTPQDAEGSSDVLVGRIRLACGETRSKLLQYWCVADNLLKGAATNSVQIMNLALAKRY